MAGKPPEYLPTVVAAVVAWREFGAEAAAELLTEIPDKFALSNTLFGMFCAVLDELESFGCDTHKLLSRVGLNAAQRLNESEVE